MLTPEQQRALLLGDFLPERPESWHLMSSYVEQAKLKSPGGGVYFDTLDRLVSYDGDIHRALVDKVLEVHGDRPRIIVSGQFGIQHERWSRANRARRLPMVLRGGLRYDNGPHYGSLAFEDYRRRMMGQMDWVFVDDSMYVGRTMRYVRDLVLMTGGRFLGSVVAYDGSDPRDGLPEVHSLYRYFDHHPLPE